jgi:hypothetical protein
MLANDTWQKEEILAAKLENFLTTVLINNYHNFVLLCMHIHFPYDISFVCFFFF